MITAHINYHIIPGIYKTKTSLKTLYGRYNDYKSLVKYNRHARRFDTQPMIWADTLTTMPQRCFVPK